MLHLLTWSQLQVNVVVNEVRSIFPEEAII
jgi:hypothetical protein